ncbi:hypothetical protein ACWEOR_27705 [Micromonospora chalcea]
MGTGTISVRNASTNHIYLATFKFQPDSGATKYLVLPNIPPCTTLSLPSDAPGMKKVISPDESFPDSLTFQDAGASWARSFIGRLARAEGDDFPDTKRHQIVADLVYDAKWTSRLTRIDGCI